MILGAIPKVDLAHEGYRDSAWSKRLRKRFLFIVEIVRMKPSHRNVVARFTEYHLYAMSQCRYQLDLPYENGSSETAKTKASDHSKTDACECAYWIV